jgi:hypothetical protein
MTTRSTLLAALLTAACAAHEGEPDAQAPDVKPRAEYELQPDETPDPDPEPDPPKVAKMSISSVQLLADCPDPVSTAPAGASRSEPAPSAVAPGATANPSMRGRGIRQPCAQSMMQVAFTDHGPQEARVSIKEVRILSADGKLLDELMFRDPMAWLDETYKTWDETLAPNADLKGSYKLTPPDWSQVEQKLGSPSFGPNFVLEVDVEIAGVRQIVRSPEFVRELEHVIVT